jgi:hypothetical protein
MKNKNKENDKVDRKKEENPKNGKHKAWFSILYHNFEYKCHYISYLGSI